MLIVEWLPLFTTLIYTYIIYTQRSLTLYFDMLENKFS